MKSGKEQEKVFSTSRIMGLLLKYSLKENLYSGFQNSIDWKKQKQKKTTGTSWGQQFQDQTFSPGSSLGCVDLHTKNHEAPPFFYKLGEKVSDDVYYKVLGYHILPWLKVNYLEVCSVWIHFGIPNHTPKMYEFCKDYFVNFWPSFS